MPALHTERARAHHIRLPFRQPGHHDLAAEQCWNQEVRQRHKSERRADHHRGMEMSRHVDGVVNNDVDLLGTHNDA